MLRFPHDARPRSDRIHPHSRCAVFHISRYSARRIPLFFMASHLSSPLPSPLSASFFSSPAFRAFPFSHPPLRFFLSLLPSSRIFALFSRFLIAPRFFSRAYQCFPASSLPPADVPPFLLSSLLSCPPASSSLPLPSFFHAYPARVELCRTAQQSLLCPLKSALFFICCGKI